MLFIEILKSMLVVHVFHGNIKLLVLIIWMYSGSRFTLLVYYMAIHVVTCNSTKIWLSSNSN